MWFHIRDGLGGDPQTLSYQISLNCPIGADVRQRMTAITVHAASNAADTLELNSKEMYDDTAMRGVENH